MSLPGPLPPPGMRSPDGDFVWNGAEWVPVGVGSGAPPGGARPGLIVGAVLVLILIAVGAFFVVGRRVPPTQPVAGLSPSATGTSTAAPTLVAAVHFADPHGRWSATFGGQPTTTDTTESTAQGSIPYQYAEWVTIGSDQTVGVLVIPAGATFDMNAGLQGIATSSGGTVVSSTPGTFQGYPSIDGVVSLSGRYLGCREVRVRNLIYIAVTVGRTNPPADFAAFVASLKLTPG